MPYIKKQFRQAMEHGEPPHTAGDLNYKITRVCLDWLDGLNPSYQHYAEVVMTLECAKLEFYRRMLAPYEDNKIKENGDVYPS